MISAMDTAYYVGHSKLSLVQRCPILGVSFKRGSTVVTLFLKLTQLTLFMCTACYAKHHVFHLCMIPHADNEIDGDAFLELSESDIRSLVPKLGMVKKISRLQKQLVS